MPSAPTSGPSPDPLSRLPAALRDVPYAGARHPGAAPLPGRHPYDVTAGANCQLYAYAVLRHFGRTVPPLRSAELWADTAATERTAPPGPLDLVLFDAGEVPGRPAGYGAHVGVHLGPDQVLHLCKEAGRPAVWSYADFAERARYARFLGAKRVRQAPVSR
ncbi:cell wall hydrolase [Streptomyces rimosus subsp. pseudoverticillatus]|uniref:CHAP domain-containing protein n=1 Tax=Streptomyces rimosus TaxID=1927 RepID=UPI0006B291DE|nr:CHAP domain-containing protein [Streptomyces rimosus]KOT73782.1 cell wall hydrolase [Streptomyces rimosus subsp. pseudoverticillatus]